MRIGADVAPHWWHPQDDQYRPPGHDGRRAGHRERVAQHAEPARSCTASLWLNDPDCLMLRTRATELSPSRCARGRCAVGVCGGMALVSDDLALLDADARRLLDEVVALGRASDAEARAGGPAPLPRPHGRGTAHPAPCRRAPS